MKKLFILAIAAVGLLACNGKNEPENSDNSKNPSTSATITCNPTSKTVNGAGGEFTVTITSNATWSATADKSWVTVSPNSGQGDAFVTVKVAAGNNDEARVLFSNGNSSATLIVKREAPAGDGKFSVSASKQVQFSQGNLQYQASTRTWRFAEHQYDIIGSDNSNISASYSGWIDLFGWGTGNNPTNSSEDYKDYSTFVDWGVNAISNGGNQANLWRTLTKDEWVYLFCTRWNASILFGLGSVNGVNGTIILPDSWTTPQGASFTPSTSKGLADLGGYYLDKNGDHFGDNIYTAEQWAVMESAGAVFLPAAGSRQFAGVHAVGSYGFYWTPSGSDDHNPPYLNFGSNCIYPSTGGLLRTAGCSVRLVR